MDNELLMRAMIAEMERATKSITPSLPTRQRPSIRANIAVALARLALSIDRDTAQKATDPRSVDFRSRLSS
jgi:hypothetical protein